MNSVSRPSLLCALLALVLAGCASPRGKFQTTKDPAYHGKLDRVLVFYFNTDTTATPGRGFSDRFVTRLIGALAQKNVPSEVVRLEPGVLDRDAPIKAAAAGFHPRQYFSFAVARVNASVGMHRVLPGELTQFSSEMTVNLEFSVIDAQSGKTVWRAQGYYYAPPRPEDLAEQVVEQLAGAQFF